MVEQGTQAGAGRLVTIDAYRGFVMLAMASAGLGLAEVADQRAGEPWIHFLASQTEHATWRGCTFWDLIQPSFMFIVGVAMPFAYAARSARGEGMGRQFAHALWRSFLLVALGVFLSSAWSKQTHFTFANVLCQIGLGYPIVFLLLNRSTWVQVLAVVMIVVGYWAFFAFTPLPREGFAYHNVGVRGDFDGLTGLLMHWGKNTNAAAAFDRWFLNLFPRPANDRFQYNDGGYATLNFVPSMATMLLGVLAGRWLRADARPRKKIEALVIAGALGLVIGTILDTTLCPVVKRIWTPSWVVYSTGWTCWLLALFYGLTDAIGWRRWAFPLVVVGANSIAFYVMAQLLKPWVANQLRIHLTMVYQVIDRGRAMAAPAGFAPASLGRPFSGDFGAMYQSAAVLVVLWLVAFAMYRRRVFIRL